MAVSIIQIPKSFSPQSCSTTSTNTSTRHRRFTFIIHSISSPNSNLLSSCFLSPPNTNTNTKPTFMFHCSYRRRYYGNEEDKQLSDDDDDDDRYYSFNEAVELFNKMDYYKCHHFLEHLWNESSPNDPLRTLFHAILQCSVGFHHLFNHNHRGAMIELGEGLCKLRKFNFQPHSPFLQFQLEISASLHFLYQTQLELAACEQHCMSSPCACKATYWKDASNYLSTRHIFSSDDICIAMDQTERSYQLLGRYAAGQRLYSLGNGPDQTMYIFFSPETVTATATERSSSYGSTSGNPDPPRVKLPTLHATEQHLTSFYYDS